MEPNIIERFRNESYLFGMRLGGRFGVPSENLECYFLTSHVKMDLFFMYQNNTHYLATAHVPEHGIWTFAAYPRYDLCSVDYLGYKVLAPCTTEQVILSGNI